MNDERIAEGLLFTIGVVFFLFASLAFFVAFQTWSAAPLFAGLAAALLSYIGFRGSQMERQ